MKLPILYTVGHASHDFGDFADKCALDDDERVRFSDYGTLDTVPRHTTVIAAKSSRGLIDLNRAPEHPDLYPIQDFSDPRENIWQEGKQLTDKDKVEIKNTLYDTYHQKILQHVSAFGVPGIVVSWHNTAHHYIGKNDSGKRQMMPPFILSNLGDEGSADSKENTTSCSPELLLSLANNLKKS